MDIPRSYLPVFGVIPLCFLLVVSNVAGAGAQQERDTACFKFVNPQAQTIITRAGCTLSVMDCPGITSVEFFARYIPASCSIPEITNVGVVTRPPFTLFWDISAIPNQLYYGAACYAEATLANKATARIKQEGVFLMHQPVAPPSCTAAYAGELFGAARGCITLTSPDVPYTATVAITWNETALRFHITVDNPHFNRALPKEKLDNVGVLLGVDPKNTRTPYVDRDILVFRLPVVAEPKRLYAEPIYGDNGSFELRERVDTCHYFFRATANDFTGYGIQFEIPRDALGSSLPQYMGGTIIAAVVDENAQIHELSWVQGNRYIIRSPYAYGRITLSKRPLFANVALYWIGCFLLGAVCGLITLPVLKYFRRFNPMARFENQEHDEELLKHIATIIDVEITNKKFSLEELSSRLSIKPAKAKALLRRRYDRSLKKHLQYCRIEIVKERLRSSNASEISIATTCGFTSIREMEKAFRALNGMSPYHYREKHRIS